MSPGDAITPGCICEKVACVVTSPSTCRHGGMLSAASLAALSGVEGRNLLVKSTSDGCFSFPPVASLPVILAQNQIQLAGLWLGCLPQDVLKPNKSNYFCPFPNIPLTN